MRMKKRMKKKMVFVLYDDLIWVEVEPEVEFVEDFEESDMDEEDLYNDFEEMPKKKGGVELEYEMEEDEDEKLLEN